MGIESVVIFFVERVEKAHDAYTLTKLKFKIKGWQTKVESALDQVDAVKEFANQKEVQTVISRAKEVLEDLDMLEQANLNDSTLWCFRERCTRVEELTDHVLAFAGNVSARAKAEKLKSVKAVDKGGLLDIFKKKTTNEQTVASMAFLTDVTNAYIQNNDTSEGVHMKASFRPSPNGQYDLEYDLRPVRPSSSNSSSLTSSPADVPYLVLQVDGSDLSSAIEASDRILEIEN